MKLSYAFTENHTLLKRALETGDTAALEYLRTRKDRYLGSAMSYADFKEITPEIATIFTTQFTDEHWNRWGFKKSSGHVVLDRMFCVAIIQNRVDLMDIYMTAKIPTNEGAARHHGIHFLCPSSMPEPVKIKVLQHLLGNGIDQIPDRNSFLQDAAGGGFITGFDVLKPLLTVDIHSDNEHMLRHAATHKQKEMCLHLVRTHGADVDVALITERTLGNQAAADVLEAVRQEIKPDARPAPTIAGLSQQVQTLETTVAQLQETVRELSSAVRVMQQPVLRLDKKNLQIVPRPPAA